MMPTQLASTTLLISEIFPPWVGGSSRWFWEIYRRLPRDRYVIAAGRHPRQDDFDAAHDLRVIRSPLALPDVGICGLRGLRGYGRAVGALRRIVRSQGIERLHCGRCVPEGWIALALKMSRGLPYMCYVHGEEVKLGSSGETPGVMSSRQLRYMTGLVLRRADYVVANSRNTERILRDEWDLPADRIRRLHPGVDTQRFRPAPRDAGERARLGWGDRPVVLTVGRLMKRKGHDRMIRALEVIRGTIPDILYVILGDGEERRALRDLAERAGVAANVRFLGEVDEDQLVACYQQCDLFVLPNRQVGEDIEGFGMVLLEAQACGKPVVAGDSGGTAETMRVPETGRILRCDDPDELAAVVPELLADPARLARMGDAARDWTVERFDWDALGQQARRIFGEPPDDRVGPDVVAAGRGGSSRSGEGRAWPSEAS